MENNRELIAYCGLYCGDCFGNKGNLADLSRDLRKELRQARFGNQAEFMAKEPYFAVFKDYKKCYDVLGAIVKMRCKRACRGGGGPPFCKMRKCCQKKVYEGCWECDDFESCSRLDFLKPIHGDAHINNMKRIRKNGVEAFLAGKRDW